MRVAQGSVVSNILQPAAKMRSWPAFCIEEAFPAAASRFDDDSQRHEIQVTRWTDPCHRLHLGVRDLVDLALHIVGQ